MKAKQIGFWVGPLFFALTLSFLRPEGMSPTAIATLACALWMGAWWVSETVPMAATALLPLVLFPFTGIATVDKAAAPFADQIIFLFVGGFMLAAAVERWNLHKRIALAILARMGGRPSRIILGFMIGGAFLSMWLSNTATAIMMVPIGLSIVRELEEHGSADTERFAKAMLLGIAYSCSIGGIATLIGTPTNAIFAKEAFRQTGQEVSFLQWFVFALPISVVLLISAWWYLTHWGFRLNESDGADYQTIKNKIAVQRKRLGKTSVEERKVLAVFGLVVLVWISAPLVVQAWLPEWKDYIKDSSWAIAGAVVLFLLPASPEAPDQPPRRLLDWETAERIPWGILLLFGGGLTLAEAFKTSGLSLWIGEQIGGLSGLPLLFLLLLVVAMVNFLTEITSNMATVSMILPILAGLSETIGIHPYWLMIGATMAASCAFMLPVATAPNAIVFAANRLRIGDMVKTGLALNILSILLFSLYIYWMLPLVLIP